MRLHNQISFVGFEFFGPKKEGRKKDLFAREKLVWGTGNTTHVVRRERGLVATTFRSSALSSTSLEYEWQHTIQLFYLPLGGASKNTSSIRQPFKCICLRSTPRSWQRTLPRGATCYRRKNFIVLIVAIAPERNIFTTINPWKTVVPRSADILVVAILFSVSKGVV